MKKKSLFIVIALSITPIALYAYNFYKLPFSEKISDWANFGTYASGSTGVIILAITLYYLHSATLQQDKIIEKQDELMEAQKNEFSNNEKYRATEMAITHFITINSSFIDNHIKKPLHIFRYLLTIPDGIDDDVDDLKLVTPSLHDSLMDYFISADDSYPILNWLKNDKIDLKTRFEVINHIIEPIFDHLQIVVPLSDNSSYTKNFIQYETASIDIFFEFFYSYYEGYRKEAKIDKYLQATTPINHVTCYLDKRFSVTYSDECKHIFWEKLGEIAALYENNNINTIKQTSAAR